MKKSAALLGSILGLCVGCTGPEAGVCTVAPPPTWDAPQFDANAAEALALRAQLDALVGDATMRGAETGDATVDGIDDLTGPFGAGDPSLESVTTPFYTDVMADVFAEFVEAIAAGPVDLVEGGAFTPGEAGGIFGSNNRAINEGGLAIRQFADKGLFTGGALYSYALGLTEADIDPATVEAIGAAWGTNAALDPEMATDSANYSEGMGYHASMVEALVAAHAYAADDACVAERHDALRTFFHAWELSMFARFVYYANAAATALGAVGDDDDVAEALHQLTEGLGLALGFRGVATPGTGPLAESGRVVTDAQIDAMMDALGVNTGDLGASTTGEFVSDPSSVGDAVLEVEGIAAEAFGLDAADVEAWGSPTPG